ncbi:hypothetical protein V7024_14335, partial [Bacillus sp. JJ864]|uniref:hypothetical protein n=1 Tax=Bacillus sp. JJ864 TaxID=3122975 RepID=UPI003000A4A9
LKQKKKASSVHVVFCIAATYMSKNFIVRKYKTKVCKPFSFAKENAGDCLIYRLNKDKKALSF